jgi:hypothetical protein
MNINFTPISMFDSYSLEVSGGSIVIDGQEYALIDLAAIVSAEQSLPKFVVTASADSVTLLLPYWVSSAPEPVSIVAEDGPVELPA